MCVVLEMCNYVDSPSKKCENLSKVTNRAACFYGGMAAATTVDML